MAQDVIHTQHPTKSICGISLPSALLIQLRNDARLIGRDSFLSGLFVYITLLAVVLRFGLPALAENFADNPDITFTLADFFPMLIGYISLFAGSLVAGMIIGFIVLDERDDNTIKALLVTPLPVRYYIAYRVLVPMLIAFVIILLNLLIINIALPEFWQIVVISAFASMSAPLIMLFFATVAQNKVQGFAMNKIVGTLGLLIFAAWFVETPLQYVIGLFPPYWFVKGYWLAVANDPNWFLFLVIGAVWTSVVLSFFVRRFYRIAYR
jgi:fluoroquinolone transport system permease protein